MGIAKKVRELITSTIAKPGESHLQVDGIMNNFAFDVQKIDEHKEEITELVKLMPETFRKSEGGGWSFLNLCMDKDGNQWGEHSDMEALTCLAIAAGIGSYLLPREMWKALPGSVPYIAFDI